MNNYKVYMHTFPDGKRYIGSTSQPLEQRWNNGRGYYYQTRVFDAICKFGWDNVRHYLLFDNLSKDEAHTIENALIKRFKSNQKAFGYNASILPVSDSFVIPKYNKKRVACAEIGSVVPPLATRNSNKVLSKPIIAIEAEEVFESISDAARCFMVTPHALKCALDNPQYTSCGYHWRYIDKE